MSAPRNKLWPLALASLGVVYGDIGTSPLYAVRESLRHAQVTPDTFNTVPVYGVASLMLWTLILVATLKYVMFILRADNQGEGGTLSLMALAQRAVGRRTPIILLLGMLGCALFYGDALITPAISVFSAIEGLSLITPAFEAYTVPLTAGILIILFGVQRHGTAIIGSFFGPVMLVWFVVLMLTGLVQVAQNPSILAAINPYYGWKFLTHHGFPAILALGGVFLVVTGTETMYADLGHFGRRAISRAWVGMVFPALVCNYLGQAALVLRQPETLTNPFFLMVPDYILPVYVGMAMVATIIASQAVISGAFSVTRQAVQLGLLPRLEIRHTSESQAGQIYVPKINWLMLIGVMVLVFGFQGSSGLAAAYGIAVSGTMVITSLFSFVVFYKIFRWPLLLAGGLSVLFILVDLTFFTVNLAKIFQGGWLPIVLAGGMFTVIHVWTKGNAFIEKKTNKSNMLWNDFATLLEQSTARRVPGTALYLTSDLTTTPATLVTNMALNQVVHERNFIVSVTITPTPRVDPEHRVQLVDLPPKTFTGIHVYFGYAEVPNITRALGYHLKKMNIDIDLNEAVFIIGHRSYKPSPTKGLKMWQDYIYLTLNRSNIPPTDHFHLPPARVLELGTQVVI